MALSRFKGKLMEKLDNYEMEIIRKGAEILMISEEDAKEMYLSSPSIFKQTVQKEVAKWKRTLE